MSSDRPFAVMFVCVANICRSPALMAVLQHLALQKNMNLHVDSSGIGWAHLGERPSLKMFEAAKKKGIVIEHRAQQFREEFFETFDWILAVNEEIYEQLKLRGPQFVNKIRLVSDFSKKVSPQEGIPDPYYLSATGFDDVMDLIIDCCEGILKKIGKRT